MAVKKSVAAAKGQAAPAQASPADDDATSRDIWFAGLGALAKAQAEGGKAFEALVSEGIAMQRKTQAMAQERLAEAAQRMEALTASASSAASGRWDKLEGIFEDRVARALARLGMPRAEDLERLVARIEALEQRLPPAASAKPAATTARKRPAAKTPGARSSKN